MGRPLHSRGSMLAAAVLHTAWNMVGLALPDTDLAGRALLGCAVLAVAGIVTIGGGLRLARPASASAAAEVGLVLAGRRSLRRS